MTTNIQIIPTLFCNMSCDGCYLSANKNKQYIDIKDYTFISNYIYNYNYNFLKINKNIATMNQLEISLLGGEVTAVYSCSDILNIKKNLKNDLKKYFPNIVFGIQTNLMLNKKEIDCLVKNKIKFGTSFNFDTTRKYNNDVYKYYIKFFENYNYIIKKYNIKPGIIIVINKDNINFIESIIKELIKNDFYLVLSPFEELGDGMYNPLSVDNQKLSDLYINLYNYVCENNIYTEIQPLKNFLLIFFNKNFSNKICGFENYCHKKALSFFYNEKVYICPEYQSTLKEKTEIGNWKTGEIFKENIISNIYKSYELPKNCKNCKFLEYCYGICPAKRLANNFQPPYYCKTYYQIFEFLNNLYLKNNIKFKKLIKLFNL